MQSTWCGPGPQGRKVPSERVFFFDANPGKIPQKLVSAEHIHVPDMAPGADQPSLCVAYGLWLILGWTGLHLVYLVLS